MTNHLVMFSGGIASWLTAKRVAAKHGTDTLHLVFADTLMEDEDLYRFLDEAAANVGGTLVRLKGEGTAFEGLDPWGVFEKVRFLGNTRIDPCSKNLKRDRIRQWVEDNFEPATAIIYLGLDWTEEHRLERAMPYWSPWKVEAPLMEKPRLMKEQMLTIARMERIKPPRLYDMGFPHNNCGGFCIKAGQAHFQLLLRKMPERYAYHEKKELALQEKLGKNVTILRDRTGGTTKPLSLRELRLRLECGTPIDEQEWGGCGCFVDS